eukprot:TRINITY_DN653_c0_g1_i1.p1 TRINITY_DN653_c0_g1~~TRINITY_DN653_c0_g1_i1.p1  ORF type:complete len:1103 (-),score=215.05 TRINITY_DN653_c0_g1_i1:840-4148(-)
MSEPDRRLFAELPPDTDPPPFPSLPLTNPIPPPATAPAPPQHPLVSLATAAHSKPRKPQPRRPRPKPAAPTLLPAPAATASAPTPQLPHHISQHPLGHMFMHSHPSLFQQQFPGHPQSHHLRAALLPQQQKLPLQTQSQPRQTQQQLQQQPTQQQQQQTQQQQQPSAQQQQQQHQQQQQQQPQPQQRQLQQQQQTLQQQQQRQQHPPSHSLAFIRSQASNSPSPSLYSRRPSSDQNAALLQQSQRQHHHQQTQVGVDPRLAKFDVATLEQVLRTTTDPQVFATLSKHLNFLRNKPASTVPTQQIQSSASAFPAQHNSRVHQTPPAVPSQQNLRLGANPSVSQSALLQRQRLLQKQHLYNQHHLNPQRSLAHDSQTLSKFPFNTTSSQDPLTASLTQNIGSLPPHLQHHLQAQLQSRQLQAQQQGLQMQKPKANSSHSQASQATHSNSTSRRPSPSSKRPPRHSPKTATIGVSDINGVASSTSGARANPNHALSQSFEDTQPIGSMRSTELRNADLNRNVSQFLPSNPINSLAHVQTPSVVPEAAVRFEIDTKKIDDERDRVLRERELKGRGNQKKQRLQHRPWNDYMRVHNPDYTTPFQGLVDAFERIVPFHVLLPPEDSSVSSEEWKKCTDDLSEKYNGYFKKLRGHCDRLYDSNFEAIGEEIVLGQSSLTTEDSILMERILLDDYSETVRKELQLAQRRAAEAEAKNLEELNRQRQRQLLQSQLQQGLSVRGAPASSQPGHIPQFSQHAPLHPGPQPSFSSLSVPLCVSNGSVSTSHVIVSAGAQAALWRQASPDSSQMLTSIQNNGVAQANSSNLVGLHAAQMQRFGSNNGGDADVVNQGITTSSGSEVFLGSRPPEQLEAEQYMLAQSQLSKSACVAQSESAVPEVGSPGLADGIEVGAGHIGSENMEAVEMSGTIRMTPAESAGSQASAGVDENGGNNITLTASGSNSGDDDSSAEDNGESGQELDNVADDDGLLSSFNNDSNVGLNGHGHGSIREGRRNGVSSEGTPQSFGMQDGANVAAGLLGNLGNVDGSLTQRNAEGEKKDLSQNVSSGDKSSVDELGADDVKQSDTSEVEKDSGRQEPGALAMGSILNAEER